jgi:hypothetical protein
MVTGNTGDFYIVVCKVIDHDSAVQNVLSRGCQSSPNLSQNSSAGVLRVATVVTNHN